MWRYQQTEEVEIDASIDRVYAIASDPETVPVYAAEIARIVVVERLSAHLVLVRSYLKIAWLTFGCLYRYHYRPPTHYSGVQERGIILRGYFSLTFRSLGGRTLVTHTEGVLSPIPGFAWIAGFIYFRIIARGDLGAELERLRSLVASGA